MCTVENCNHDRISGKNAIIALAEIEAGTKVCEARHRYVLAQCKNFVDWLAVQSDNTVEDAKAICRSIYEKTLVELQGNALDDFIWTSSREDSPNLTDTMAGKDDDRSHEEGETPDVYWSILHVNAYKAWSKVRDESFFEEQMVAFLEEANNEFYANGQYLSKPTWRKVRKARTWVHNQRRTKILSYSSWRLLSNWCNKLLGQTKRYEENEWELEEVHSEPSEEDIALVYYTKD